MSGHLTDQEKDTVRRWREVARSYRHGQCGREWCATHGCDIVCLYTYAEGVDVRAPEPWKPSRRRPTVVENNAVVDLMSGMVMRAVPRLEVVATTTD